MIELPEEEPCVEPLTEGDAAWIRPLRARALDRNEGIDGGAIEGSGIGRDHRRVPKRGVADVFEHRDALP